MSKKCCEEKHGDLLLIEKEEVDTMFLSKISIHSRIITHYIVAENISFVIVYKLLGQKKY